MFRSLTRATQTGAPSTRYLKRAGGFAAALLVLWLVLQFMPTTPAPAPSAVPEALHAGTVASRDDLRLRPERSGGFMGFGYFAVVILLGGGILVAIRLHRNGTPKPFNGSVIKSVGQLHLAPNQQLRLVAVADDVLLLGVTNGQITLLQKYPRESFEAARYLPETAVVTPIHQPTSFAQLLHQHTMQANRQAS